LFFSACACFSLLSRNAAGRHHERAEEEAEDKELVNDELEQVRRDRAGTHIRPQGGRSTWGMGEDSWVLTFHISLAVFPAG
jgi:hypothetical protein